MYLFHSNSLKGTTAIYHFRKETSGTWWLELTVNKHAERVCNRYQLLWISTELRLRTKRLKLEHVVPNLFWTQCSRTSRGYFFFSKFVGGTLWLKNSPSGSSWSLWQARTNCAIGLGFALGVSKEKNWLRTRRCQGPHLTISGPRPWWFIVDAPRLGMTIALSDCYQSPQWTVSGEYPITANHSKSHSIVYNVRILTVFYWRV